MKALVVYYTLSGSTGKVAKEIKKILNFELWEVGIRRVKPKSGFFRVVIGTLMSRMVDIRHSKYNLDEYDLVFLGTPSWLGKPNSVVLSFIDKLPDLRNKKFICFSVGMLGGKHAAESLSSAVVQKNGTVLGTYWFNVNELKEGLNDEVKKFIKSLDASRHAKEA